MAANREDVNRWISSARETEDEYIISVCDTFDWEDYPVFCRDREDLEARLPEFDSVNMQRVNEIIRVPRKKDAIENISIDEFLP